MPARTLLDDALDLVRKGATATVKFTNGDELGPYPLLCMRHDGVNYAWVWTEAYEQAHGGMAVTLREDDRQVLIGDELGRVTTIAPLWYQPDIDRLEQWMDALRGGRTPPPPVEGDDWVFYSPIQDAQVPGNA